jgi:uncharacterized protein YkwD
LFVKKICWGLLCLSLIILLAACGQQIAPRPSSSNSIASDSLSQSVIQRPSPTAMPTIPSQITTPTPVPRISSPSSNSPTPSSGSGCITFSNDTTLVPPAEGGLDAPWGSSPISSEAQQLTQQLFQLINSDRAACGLLPFSWNATLASGALLHSWNMYHCGLSHYCPDGMSPYQRIANEGFAGYPDCGENIAEAGPYPTPWAGVYSVQESMAHEPLGGWHRIHLFSTTLHQIGIGVYVAPNGWIWFTEDMAS